MGSTSPRMIASVYGSFGTYGRLYRATVLRCSSSALISPSTEAERRC